MTEQAPQKPPENNTRPPLVPRPVVSILAVGLLIGMFYTIYLDSQPGDFDGGRYILMFGGGVFICLGYDVARFFKGGG